MELRKSGDDYLRQLQGLLPKGPIWPRAEGAVLTKTLRGMAEELSRVNGRALQLIEEADPRSTSELLGAWERVAGLPDECDPTTGLDFEGRRARLVQKITSRGGQTKAYFVSVAAALGVPIEITEFKPRQYGRAADYGGHYMGQDWWFVWQVALPEAVVTRRHFGASIYRGPYGDFGNQAIQCILNKLKPAHTYILYVVRPLIVDYGLVTDAVGEIVDFGEVTEAVGDVVDFGEVS